MNIFEGSRRIAKLTAAGIAVGFLLAFAYVNPETVSVSYLITDGKTPPTRVDECQSSAQSEKWFRLFEQLSPIYKWNPGGLDTVQSCTVRRTSPESNAHS